MVCCIQDQTFSGEGRLKKEAKLACSQKAIETICGFIISETKTVAEKSNPRAHCNLDDWIKEKIPFQFLTRFTQFQTILDKAWDSYRAEIVHEIRSDVIEDVDKNTNNISLWIDHWISNNS